MNHSEALQLTAAQKQARLAEFRAKALEIEIASLKEDLEREIAFNEKLTTRLLETREERLRALGFEEPTSSERRKRLANNVAMKDWPK